MPRSKATTKRTPKISQPEVAEVCIDENEVMAIIEQLSHQPYRETAQMIQILSARLHTERERLKIETGE